MKIETLLNEEVQNQIEGLSNLPLGNDDYKNTVDGIAKLTDRMIEIEKLSLEREKQFDEKETELLKRTEETKDRKWRNGIAIAGIVTSSILTVWGTRRTFEFEREGTITSMVGKGFVQKFTQFLPRK